MSAPTFTTDKIRNIAVCGHSATGKTSLVSALLYCGGATTRLGKVDDGTATTDFDDDEIQRKITINTALAHVEHEDCKINLLDTPGYSIFSTEAKQALRVADAAMIMISAVAGIEVQTDKIWKMAADFELPTFFVINSMDRDRASYDRSLEALKSRYGREVVPLQVPIGEQADFSGVVALLSQKALTFSGEGIESTKSDIPAELVDAAESAREEMVEMIAEQDEALMETYLEEGTLTTDQLIAGMASAFQNRQIFPVFLCSAAQNIAVTPILDSLVRFVPDPSWRAVDAIADGGNHVELPVSDQAKPVAYVFKTFSDPYAGRISLFRLFTGVMKSDTHLTNVGTGVDERFGGLALMQGKDLQPVSELAAGDIAAVPKLKDTHTGDTLADAKRKLTIEPVHIPEASIAFAIEPHSKGDEDKLSSALAKIREEDPTISVGRDAQTGELLMSGAGQLHIEVIVARLLNRFKVAVDMHQPKVPYRETVRGSHEATTRHKKQSGGSGQFAECRIRLEPNPGKGYEFIDKIFGGSISQGYRPAVNKGVQEASAQGVLAGYPCVDFKVTLLDGKEHAVDSSEMAFKIAGRKAFRECILGSQPTLLEPIMKVDVYAPEDSMGDVMGDLNQRRGRVQGMDTEDGQTVIKATVPLSEMLSYSPTLRSITGGRGDYHMEMSHYDEVPRNLQKKIIDQAAVDHADD